MARIWNLNELPYLEETQYLNFQLEADCDDVIALGGNLSPGLLLSAYRQGIFPWYNEGEEICWWSPRQRFVLLPQELHLPKSLRKQAKRRLKSPATASEPQFRLSIDSAFTNVISACAATPRQGQLQPDGSVATWLTAEMQYAYIDLHMRGYAHSVECWQRVEDGQQVSERLVGGLYGVALGYCFFGESMFSHVADASKMAFAAFVLFLREQGFALIDCQQETQHLQRFGAQSIERQEFLQRLKTCKLEREFSQQQRQWAFWNNCATKFPHCKAFHEWLSPKRPAQ